MKRNKPSHNKTLRSLKVWWLLLSGTTSKVLTVLGLGVAVFLIAVSTGTGTSTTTVNAKQLKVEKQKTQETIPALTLLSTESVETSASSDGNFVEILASKKSLAGKRITLKNIVDDSLPETKIVVAQSTTQSELQKLVNKAMNPEEPAAPVIEAPIAQPKPASDSTSDQLKALINQSTPSASGSAPDNYISTLNAEVETTVVMDEETAQLPASSAGLSNSDRMKLIQDIAQKVAEDSDSTAQNVQYVTVQENDSLWLIAKRVYNDAYQYKFLYQANKDILLNENTLVVGQQLRVPNLN